MKVCQGRWTSIFLGGCVLWAALGCQIQRTGHGILCRGRWSLEIDTRRPAEIEAERATAAMAEASDVPRLPQQPEIIPWRNRLKGYRLAQRILHRAESDAAVSIPPAPVAE